MKVAELEGALLDYWVGRAQGWTIGRHKLLECDKWVDENGNLRGMVPAHAYQPSVEWRDGGAIIERERISVVSRWDDWRAGYEFDVTIEYGDPVMELEHEQVGSTPLIAAMRAFVASKLGAEVPDIVLKSGENPLIHRHKWH